MTRALRAKFKVPGSRFQVGIRSSRFRVHGQVRGHRASQDAFLISYPQNLEDAAKRICFLATKEHKAHKKTFLTADGPAFAKATAWQA
jgi:hypothetical protein